MYRHIVLPALYRELRHIKKKSVWIYKVFFMSFFLAAIFSAVSNYVAENFNNIVLGIILLIVILIGVIFDIIGVSVLTATESTYHAKAAKKIKGAKESVVLLRNATQVSNFCNDIVGDICGIVSGGLGAVLAISISTKFNINGIFITIIVASLISSLTVGSKAIGKDIADKYCDEIVFLVGKIKSFLKMK